MTKSQARTLAGRCLEALQADSEVGLAINDELTQEHSLGFIFFYNSADYWRTRDMMKGLAGNGPILVKQDGEIVILPTYQSIETSLQSM